METALQKLKGINKAVVNLASEFQNGTTQGLRFVLGDYGFLNPMLAAAAMAASSVTVVTNSLRLRKFRLS